MQIGAKYCFEDAIDQPPFIVQTEDTGLLKTCFVPHLRSG